MTPNDDVPRDCRWISEEEARDLGLPGSAGSGWAWALVVAIPFLIGLAGGLLFAWLTHGQ